MPRRLAHRRVALALLAVLLAVGCEGTSSPPTAAPWPATVPPRPVAAEPPVVPWLGPPWVLQSATSSAWVVGAPAGYLFCGRAHEATSPVEVREQVLRHPSGRLARLLELSPEATGEAFQLFKLSYDSCRVPGRVEGVGGPRNLWSDAGRVAGSEPVGDALRVVELWAPSAGPAPSRPQVEVVMDDWAS